MRETRVELDDVEVAVLVVEEGRQPGHLRYVGDVARVRDDGAVEAVGLPVSAFAQVSMTYSVLGIDGEDVVGQVTGLGRDRGSRRRATVGGLPGRLVADRADRVRRTTGSAGRLALSIAASPSSPVIGW